MTNSAVDKEDFCRLVEVHQSALYRTARSILSNQQDVEDAVQEAVCAAYSHLDRLREPEKFKAWLLKIWSTSAMTSAAGSGGPWTSTRWRNP